MAGMNSKGRFTLVLIAVCIWGLANTAQTVIAQEDPKSEKTIKAQETKEVVIGINVPITGPYNQQGQDQERTYKMAIDRINAKGGVLGKKISYVLKDTKLNPKIAKKNAEEFILQNKAVMVTGGSSSSVAIAQSDLCQKYKTIFMAAGTHSNAVTGHMRTKAGRTVQKAHRHTFRWFFTAWMTNKALVPFLIQRFGKAKSYFYITADYTWGHSLEESMKWGTELAGCDTLGAIRTPLGKKDFRAELKKAKEAGPDILILTLFGNDMITALRQAKQMGLKDDIKIVVPLMEINMAKGVGAEAMEGVMCTVQWYWGLRDRFRGTRDYVDAFMKVYGKPPGSVGACAWVAVHQWASAVERAGSFSSSEVIRALEGHKFTLLKDQEEWRAWDHQAVSSVFIMEGKSKGEAKGDWDLLKVIGEKKGVSVIRTREENPVYLEALPGE
jgi:ABC-type branched-subunit amino acid transport system substrate-binding protein